MNDPLGDRMKAIEDDGAPARLRPDLPIYARIDGRGFSRFTRGMKKPFDLRLTRAMQATTRGLMEATHANCAYVQSDEISLLWAPGEEWQEPFFGGRPFKMVSVLAGLATAHFTRALLDDPDGLAAFAHRLPHFDARVCQFPGRPPAADMFAWRGEDARRNGIQMLAQAHFSHKALHGKSTGVQVSMLREAGVHLEEQVPATLNGCLMRRIAVTRPFTDGELAAIPEAHRPDPGTPVRRHVIEATSALHPGWCRNLEEVLFDQADPLSRDEEHRRKKMEAGKT